MFLQNLQLGLQYYIGKIRFRRHSRESNDNGLKREDFNFSLIEYYFKNKDNTDSFQVISKQVMNDIDFDELFMFIDRTHSKVGQQYLYDKLLVIPSKLDFDEQERVISNLEKANEIRQTVESLLSKLNIRNLYYIPHLFLDTFISKPKWFWVVNVLSVLGLFAFVFSFFIHKFFLLLLAVYLVNMVIHFWNKRNIMVYMDSIPQLMLFVNVGKELARLNLLAEYKPSILASVASISKLKYFIKLFKLDSTVKSDIEAIVLFLWEMVKILLLIEPITVFKVFEKLIHKRNDIQNIFEYIGKIDSAKSIATIREDFCLCKPCVIKGENFISFKDMYHPLIPNCISNSLPRCKSMILTGSNMSGKTTFIRTIAINLLFAQTINSCFAKKIECTQTRLSSAIRISDDLLNNKSYYLEEVLTIKEMIDSSSTKIHNSLFLDELFKGTNTIERIAAGKSVLSYLNNFSNNIIFVSTHDNELADLLGNEFELYHFTEVIQDKQIVFDYKLKEGNLSTRNAIRILEVNGYPIEIITNARNIIHDIQDSWVARV